MHRGAAGDDVRLDEYDAFGWTSIVFDFGRDPGIYHRSHTHLSIELSLVRVSGVTFDWKGGAEQVVPDEVVLFYSGFPHGLVRAESDAVLHIIQVPIVDVLSWAAPPTTLHRLLAGDFIRDAARSDMATLIDEHAFARWHDDLHGDDVARHQAARLEIEARVRRQLAGADGTADDRDRHVHSATVAGVTAAARFIARHYVEPITVDDVAAAVGWNRAHLLASFREVCAIPLAQYITRLRLAEAQRLLTTTQLSVLTVCHCAGFSSTVRMYDAFNRHLGTTPGEYRQRAAG